MEQVKLKKKLSEKGITVYRLSKETKINSSDLYQAINGKKPMFPKWRRVISDFLKTDEQFLFESGE